MSVFCAYTIGLIRTFTCHCEQDDAALSLDVRDHKVSDQFNVVHPSLLSDACNKSRQIHERQIFEFLATDLQRNVVARERDLIVLDSCAIEEHRRARARVQNSTLCTSNAFLHLVLVGNGIPETFDARWDSIPTDVRMKMQFDNARPRCIGMSELTFRGTPTGPKSR